MSDYVAVPIRKEIHEYLQEVASISNQDVSGLVERLLFDGIAYNVVTSALEEAGVDINELVKQAISKEKEEESVEAEDAHSEGGDTEHAGEPAAVGEHQGN